MKTLNNCIFDSIYFLANELNKIDKFSNLIQMNPKRVFIENILLDHKYLLINDKSLKENIDTFPLIRETSINLSNNENNEPDFLLYLLSGQYFSNNSQKTIEFLKECKPAHFIQLPLFQYFITNGSKYGGFIFLEDTLVMNFNTIYSIIDDDFNITEISQKELRLLYLQNNIIAELGNFFYEIYGNLINTNQRFFMIKKIYDDESLLLITLPSILRKNPDYCIPESLKESLNYINIRLYELLSFANLKIYFEMKFNLDSTRDKEKLDKVMIQTILSYCLHRYITSQYFNKEYEENYNKEKENYILFAKCINDIIDLWKSDDFKNAEFEYKYYYAFRPYEVEH